MSEVTLTKDEAECLAKHSLYRAVAKMYKFNDDLTEAISERTDYLVTILVDDHLLTEYLEYDGHYDRFIWVNDWYEGQENVKFVGCVPVRDLRVEGSGESVTVEVRNNAV